MQGLVPFILCLQEFLLHLAYLNFFLKLSVVHSLLQCLELLLVLLLVTRDLLLQSPNLYFELRVFKESLLKLVFEVRDVALVKRFTCLGLQEFL